MYHNNLLSTIKNTYFAIAYTCLGVSPPFFLLKNDSSKVFPKWDNILCQKDRCSRCPDCHGAPVSPTRVHANLFFFVTTAATFLSTKNSGLVSRPAYRRITAYPPILFVANMNELNILTLNTNFHPSEVVDRGSETQLHLDGKSLIFALLPILMFRHTFRIR